MTSADKQAPPPPPRPFDDMTDEQLRTYEQRLYDDMVDSDRDAAERHDDVVVEMNYRGMLDRNYKEKTDGHDTDTSQGPAQGS